MSGIDFDVMSSRRRRAWVQYVAWMLRVGMLIPPLLLVLRADAERYNEERGPAGLGLEEDDVAGLMDDHVVGVRLQADLIVEHIGDAARRVPVRFVRAGQTMAIRGFRQGVTLTAEALRNAVMAGMFNGVAVFFTHTVGERDVRDLAGVTAEAWWDEDENSANGWVHLYQNRSGSELRALAADFRAHKAENIPIPDVGVSIDSFWRFRRGSDGAPVSSAMTELRSVDIVFRPAADGRILAEQRSARASQSGEVMEEGSASAGPQGSRPNNGQGGNNMDPERVAELLAEAGLPEEVVERLQAGSYEGEEELEEAIQLAQAEPPPSNGPGGGGLQRSYLGQADQWVASLRQDAVDARLAQSGLPEPVRRRLAAQAYGSPEEMDEAIQAARQELAELAEQSVIRIGGEPPRWSGISGMQTGMDAIERAVNWHFGVHEDGPPEPELRDIRRVYQLITGDYEWHGVFRPERVMLTGATTGTLANLAANAMNKVIVQQFSLLSHWRWYERVAFPTPNDGSVQDMQWSVLGGIQNLPTVSEKGAYEELDMDDVSESDSFTKYGGYVPVTIELIRNSDIQRLQAVPRALAIAAVRTRSAQVSNIFTTASGVGPTLSQDSTALFHANHSNVATTALGTDNTAWRAARSECFQHTEVNSGKVLGLFPRYLLVPAELYDQALVNFGYGEGMPTTYTPEAESRGFVDPRPVPLVVPDWTDANDWAYIVDPMIFPVIHISYAQAPGGGSHPAPELFTVSSPTAGLMFTNDVMPIKVRDWFAVGVNGYRGIGKRNVT